MLSYPRAAVREPSEGQPMAREVLCTWAQSPAEEAAGKNITLSSQLFKSWEKESNLVLWWNTLYQEKASELHITLDLLVELHSMALSDFSSAYSKMTS